jgi:hypothetical protein
MTTPQYQALEEIMRKKRDQAIKKKISKKIGIASLIFTAVQLWFSQLIIWGLSLYGIHSGIWGVYLIMLGVTSPLIACVRLGMLETIRDSREINGS